MFLIRFIWEVISFPFRLLIEPLRLLAGIALRAALLSLVAIAVLGHTQNGAAPEMPSFERNIDAVTEKLASLDTNQIVLETVAWYGWAKDHLAHLNKHECPKNRQNTGSGSLLC